jgi:hypothetical protein
LMGGGYLLGAIKDFHQAIPCLLEHYEYQSSLIADSEGGWSGLPLAAYARLSVSSGRCQPVICRSLAAMGSWGF